MYTIDHNKVYIEHMYFPAIFFTLDVCWIYCTIDILCYCTKLPIQMTGRINRWKIDSARLECAYYMWSVVRPPRTESHYNPNEIEIRCSGVGRGDLYPSVQLRVCICVSGARGGGACAELPDFRRNRMLVTQTTLQPFRPATTTPRRYHWPRGGGGWVQRKKSKKRRKKNQSPHCYRM